MINQQAPNIVFMHTDQHTYDAISAYGNKWLKTPNIDRLHFNGISFMRSYCTDPVCAASRASWMTGRYSSETGVPFNGGSLYEDLPDLGQWLTQHNVESYHTGKWHVENRDVKQSFQTLYFGKRFIGAGGGEYYDQAISHSVVQFLAERNKTTPFFLQIGFVNPHDICEYGHNFEEKLIPDGVTQGILNEEDLPPLPDNHDFDEPETLTHKVIRRDENCMIHWPIMKQTHSWSELQWRYFNWNNYRLIEKVDAEIGVVLNALEASGTAENTLILFTADHGEAAGQHKMFQKFSLYEESVRVPFIAACLGSGVSLPKNQFNSTHFISGVDIFPTVCDYVNIPTPEIISGKSIRQIIEGTASTWRDHAYIESNYWARSIVADTYKYVTEYRPKNTEDYVSPSAQSATRGLEQLFDLETDPGEKRNLVNDPSHNTVLANLRSVLIEEESKLIRRPLLPRAQKTVDKWGKRLRDRWANYQT